MLAVIVTVPEPALSAALIATASAEVRLRLPVVEETAAFTVSDPAAFKVTSPLPLAVTFAPAAMVNEEVSEVRTTAPLFAVAIVLLTTTELPVPVTLPTVFKSSAIVKTPVTAPPKISSSVSKL